MGDRAAAAARPKALRPGHVSEYLAALYLMLKGYRIVALRDRTKLGAIAIVAPKRNLAIFVDVKARPRGDERHRRCAANGTKSDQSGERSVVGAPTRLCCAFEALRYGGHLAGRLPRHFPNALLMSIASVCKKASM